MKAKKYIWVLVTVYLAYLTHGIQAIVISQNLDQFAQQWSATAADVYNVIALVGLGKFVSVWVCGELSDRIGRKVMIAIGAVMYVLFFGILLTSGNTTIACAAAFLSGVATSFFDGACYPAVQESWTDSPSTAVIIIKGVISVSGLIYPLLVVSLRSMGAWKVGIIIPIVLSVLVLVVSLVSPFSYDEELKARRARGETGKSKGADQDTQKALARFVKKPPFFVVLGCAVYGFIAMATMYSAQQLLTRYGITVIGMGDLKAASLTSLYTAGSLAAVLIWGVFMARFRWRTLKVLLIDLTGSIVAYGLVCLVKSEVVVQFAALAIGFFAAGGALQCGVALMQEFHPGNKGRNLGIYYTFMGAASYVLPVIQSVLTANSNEGDAIVKSLMMNLGLAVVGMLFMVYLTVNYKKWYGVSAFSKKGDDE